MKIGFIGLGHMGSGMAASLLKGGHDLTVFNRSPGKDTALVEAGARRAGTPAETARDAEAVVTMLSNDAALEDIVFGDEGILRALPKGAVHVSSSTISLALAEKLDAAHRDAGQALVSAPVFGRPEAAAAAKLFVVAAGESAVMERCRPIFDAVGQRTFVVGTEPSQANLVKLSGNFLIAAVIEGLSEAFALVSKGGIDRGQYLELLTSTLFSAPVYKTYGGLIAEERYSPAGFTSELGYKDIGLALAAASKLKAPMPLASLIADRFLTLIAGGGKDLDWSALGALAKRDAGDAGSLPAAE